MDRRTSTMIEALTTASIDPRVLYVRSTLICAVEAYLSTWAFTETPLLDHRSHKSPEVMVNLLL